VQVSLFCIYWPVMAYSPQSTHQYVKIVFNLPVKSFWQSKMNSASKHICVLTVSTSSNSQMRMSIKICSN
jgi:hypothetical protein